MEYIKPFKFPSTRGVTCSDGEFIEPYVLSCEFPSTEVSLNKGVFVKPYVLSMLNSPLQRGTAEQGGVQI